MYIHVYIYIYIDRERDIGNNRKIGREIAVWSVRQNGCIEYEITVPGPKVGSEKGTEIIWCTLLFRWCAHYNAGTLHSIAKASPNTPTRVKIVKLCLNNVKPSFKHVLVQYIPTNDSPKMMFW